MTDKQILCVGAVMVDMLAPVQALPTSGEGAVVEELQTSLGGCALNSANIIRQLGQPCFLFAPIGQGTYASFARKELAKRGMRALDIENTTLDCGAALCFVEPGGQRTMVTFPGIERHFERSWWKLINPNDYASAFIAGYEVDGQGGDAIIEFFEEHPQIALTYAPGPRIMDIDASKTARINALCPTWHLNDQEAVAYANKVSLKKAADLLESAPDRDALVQSSGRTIQRICNNTVIITAGATGSYAFFDDSWILVPTSPIKPVDTIGAGDSHLGAIMAARHAGSNWEDALALANRIAAAVCLTQGSTLPDASFSFSVTESSK